MWNLEKLNSLETDSRMVITRGWGRGGAVGELGRCWSKGTNLQLEDE